MARKRKPLLEEWLQNEEPWLEERVMRWFDTLHRNPQEVVFLGQEGGSDEPSGGIMFTLGFTDRSEISRGFFLLTDLERIALLRHITENMRILEQDPAGQARDAALAAIRNAVQVLQEEVEGRPPQYPG